MDVEGNAELKGIQSANLTTETVVRDKVPATVEVSVEQSKDSIPIRSVPLFPLR